VTSTTFNLSPSTSADFSTLCLVFLTATSTQGVLLPQSTTARPYAQRYDFENLRSCCGGMVAPFCRDPLSLNARPAASANKSELGSRLLSTGVVDDDMPDLTDAAEARDEADDRLVSVSYLVSDGYVRGSPNDSLDWSPDVFYRTNLVFLSGWRISLPAQSVHCQLVAFECCCL